MLPGSQQDVKEQSPKTGKQEQPRPTIAIERNVPGRLTQGDFYRDITLLEDVLDNENSIDLTEISYPISILLNQDCDLESDFRSRSELDALKPNHDKHLLWLFFAPVYNYEQFILGEHLLNLEMKMSNHKSNRPMQEQIQKNNMPRYHFLKFLDKENMPDMIIDFKHFFTLSNPVLFNCRADKFLFTTTPLFREQISQRFAYYLSRIGLPNLTS